MQQVVLEPFNRDKYFYCWDLREKLASFNLPSWSIKTFIERTAIEEKEYLNKIKEKPIEFIPILESFEKLWIEEKGVIPPKAHTIPDMMLHTGAMPILNIALDYYKQGKSASFISYYDYVCGFFEIINGIFEAFTTLEGKSQDVTQESILGMLLKHGPLPTKITNLASRVYDGEHHYLANLLLEDLTGVLLVNQIASELAQEAKMDPNTHAYKRILTYQYPDLVVAGARFAAEIYQLLYKIWEKDGEEKRYDTD